MPYPSLSGMPGGSDACPGLLALHPGRDGLVARIRIPGGYLTATRLRSLALLADTFGGGCLDVTSRANVQLRGIADADAPRLAVSAAAHGLLPSRAHDRARNIIANPMAGLDGRPPVRALVHRLDLTLRRDALLAALPGRFLFALDSLKEPDRTWSGLAGCDVGMRVVADGAALIVAGRETGVQIPLSRASQLLRQVARQAVSAGISTHFQRIDDLPDGGAVLVAEVGGSLGTKVPSGKARLSLGARQAAVVVAAPLGRVTSHQLRLLGRWLAPGEVARLDTAGRIVVPSPSPGRILPPLAEAGLLTSDEDSLAGVTACSGMSCARSLGDVRAWAAPVLGYSAVHWAGCERCCGRPADAARIVAVDASRVRANDGAVKPVGALTGLDDRRRVVR